MFSKSALRIVFTLSLACPSVSFADPVASRVESLPASAPPACDYTHAYGRQSRSEYRYFEPNLDGGYWDDLRVTCANHADCPTYNSELAAHCAFLESFGGDCSPYPMTLNEVSAWPVPLNKNYFEASVDVHTFERVPHAPAGSVDWNPLPNEHFPQAGCNSAGCIRNIIREDNGNHFPPEITAEEMACLQVEVADPIVGRVTGCVAPETKVKLGNGEYRAAQEIRRGEMLWNPILRAPVKVAGVTRGPENVPVYELTFAGRTVRVTQNHPMVLANELKKVAFRDAPAHDDLGRATVQAKSLKVGDLLRMEDGSSARIEKISTVMLEGKRLVYNFLLEGDTPESHYFVADGVVTGDVRTQNKLALKMARGI